MLANHRSYLFHPRGQWMTAANRRLAAFHFVDANPGVGYQRLNHTVALAYPWTQLQLISDSKPFFATEVSRTQ